MKRYLLAIFVLVAITLGLYKSAGFAYFALTPAQAGSQETFYIEVKRGQPASELAQSLASQGVIASARRFVLLGRLTRKLGKIKAGEYQVSPNMTPVEVLSIVTSGISVQRPFTIREGLNIYEIANELEAKGLMTRARFLELARDPGFIQTLGFDAPVPSSLEGYLFPETYFFNRSMAPEEMVRTMVKKFQSTWGPAEQERAAALGMSRHQVVILASMVEKETGAPQERPLISSVFHNRLRKRMRLQSDPTTIYGMWENYRGNIRKSDLLTYSPYNTYMIPALPIGPIGNPGREAIKAALNPAESEFLFFVSQNDGTHVFTRSFDEHNRAVIKFQKDPNARRGKSWRDLHNKAQGASLPQANAQN